MRLKLRTALRRAKAFSAGGGGGQVLLASQIVPPLAANVVGSFLGLTDTGTSAHNCNITVQRSDFYARMQIAAIDANNYAEIYFQNGVYNIFVTVAGASSQLVNVAPWATGSVADDGDVIQASINPDGTFYIENTTKAKRISPIYPADFLVGPGKLSALGTKVGVNAFGGYAALTTMFGYGKTQPAIYVTGLTIDIQTLRPEVTFFYNNPADLLFNGVQFRQRHVFEGASGTVETVLSDWQDGVLVENSVAGQARFKAASGFTDDRRTRIELVDVRIKNQPASQWLGLTIAIPDYPSLGVNLPRPQYFSPTSYFADGVRQADWVVTGGAHAGKSMHQLRVANIIDINARPQVWPVGATEFRLFGALGQFPLPEETSGGRTLRLPPGQDFTVYDESGASVEKNLTTGVHLFTWPSGHIDGGRLDIILDQATFVPFDRLSFRRTGDVSNDIWYPWAIDNVKAFDVARLLDMIDTNNDNPETWGPVATRLNWRCSPEAVIELSNRALVNPWVLFTYQTSPEDCAYYVSMLQNGITSTVKEFPSEPWNEDWGGIPAQALRAGRLAVLSGMHLPDAMGRMGYGPAPDPTKVFFFDEFTDPVLAITGDRQGELDDDGHVITKFNRVGIPNAVTAGATLVVYRYGADGQAIYVAKSDLPAGTNVPAYPGTASDANWTYYGDAQGAPRARYIGVNSYKIAVACKAVSPRFKMLLNCRPYPDGAPGSFEYVAMTFPVTPGGTDCLGNIIDGWAMAGYSGYGYASNNDPGYALFAAETTLAGRVARLNSLGAISVQVAPIQKAAKQAFQNVLNALNRDIAPKTYVYEFTIDYAHRNMTLAQGQALTAFFKGTNGSNAYQLMSTLCDQNTSVASVACQFTFGCGLTFGAGDNYTYSVQENVKDWDSPIIKAMRDRSTYYRSLRPLS